MINAVSNVSFQGVTRERDFFQNKKPVDFASLMDNILDISQTPESIAADEVNAIAINLRNAQDKGTTIKKPELLVKAAILPVFKMRCSDNQAKYLQEVARLAQYSGCLDKTEADIMGAALDLGVAGRVGPTVDLFKTKSCNILGGREESGHYSRGFSQRSCSQYNTK